MNPLLHAISTLSAALAGSLVSAIWEGAILVLGVALCLRILPDLSAAARWVVWTNVFASVAVFAFLPFNGQPSPEWKGISGFPFPPRSIWSFAIASVWLVLTLWRGAQLISSAIYLRGLRNGRLVSAR